MTMGMLPPLQLQLGSTATSGATGSTGVGTGMGAINQGNWIIQTGQGNTSNASSAQPSLSTTGIGTTKPAASTSTLVLAAGAALLYFVMKK